MRISGITYVPRRTHKLRNILAIAALLIILAFIGTVLFSVYHAWSVTHPQHADIPPFESNIAPEYKDVLFSDINNKIKLRGWYFSSPESGKVVILAHDYGSNRLQFGIKTVDLIKRLLENGYSVMAFDFRASGKSSGSRVSFGSFEKLDLLGAVKSAKSFGAKDIVLMGFGHGASSAILAAAESPDVDAVIADSPYADLRQHLISQIPKWSGLPDNVFFRDPVMLASVIMSGADLNTASPRKAVSKMASKPLFLIHGTDDAFIAPGSSEELYAIHSKLSSGRTELWKVQGAGHLGAYEKHTAEYLDRMVSFLDLVYPLKK